MDKRADRVGCRSRLVLGSFALVRSFCVENVRRSLLARTPSRLGELRRTFSAPLPRPLGSITSLGSLVCRRGSQAGKTGGSRCSLDCRPGRVARRRRESERSRSEANSGTRLELRLVERRRGRLVSGTSIRCGLFSRNPNLSNCATLSIKGNVADDLPVALLGALASIWDADCGRAQKSPDADTEVTLATYGTSAVARLFGRGEQVGRGRLVIC